MVKFHSIAMIEKYDCFAPAKAKTEVNNGTFGAVTSGTFAPKANSFEVVMNLETGDNSYMAEYKIPAGTDLRIANLAKLHGKKLDISAEHMPASFEVGNKLVSDENGKLVVNGEAVAPYLLVAETMLFDGKGCVAEIVAE